MNNRITVTISHNGEEHDFDLPGDIPIKNMEEKLILPFSQAFSGTSIDDSVFFLRNASGYLSPDHTLQEYAVMNGAMLELVVLPE